MAQTYKVKLESGRVLGPLTLERIRLLILKNQILGRELARPYPAGDWVKIITIPEIADLLIARASGKLTKQTESETPNARAGNASPTHILRGATEMFSVAPEQAKSAEPESSLEIDEPTFVGNVPETEEHERTVVSDLEQSKVEIQRGSAKDPKSESPRFPAFERSLAALPSVTETETVMINATKKEKKRMDSKELIKSTIAAIALGIVGYQIFFSDPGPKLPPATPIIRPTLPNFDSKIKADPSASEKIYRSAMRVYLLDNVSGYRAAAQFFLKSATLDPNNVKALALLASSYINLIDSSNKDEKYFAVISELIDMTRAKNVDLPETVIADVEFFCVVNKAVAAQNRIIEYTRTHASFGLEMFYYLALAFYTRGEYQDAARYISQIPDNKVFSPKVFFLQGAIAEKLEDTDTALIEYNKALKMNSNHVKSRLRIVDIYNQRGRIAEAQGHLDFLVSHTGLLSPKDLGLAYYLHSILSEQQKNYEIALGDAERAVQLDKDNHDYLLQLYSMRAKAGQSIAKVRVDAKMYYFLGEGERLLKKGKYQDALTEFLQARQANNSSPIPLVKIGDMFSYLHDLGNARINYKMAADRAPNNIDIWSKFIDVLIQSYEWDEASKAMERFRQLPVSQSAIDKAAGDMYAKQGQYVKAQVFYRQAMARQSIDSAVYIAYAKSLMATHNYKEAPFFFALAQRYDPLNVDAVIGTAQCIANSDSIDRAIEMLRDDLRRNSGAKAEYLGAIADLQIQKGEWDQAQKTVDQAMHANPDYAYPWKLQARIYLNKEGTDKKALDEALYAYQAYSERNASDPSGYLERFNIFVKKGEYDKADDELGKIFAIYPKYPNLHLNKGRLYALMANHQRSVEEYRIELQNNPNSVPAMLALGKEYIEMNGYNEALAQFNKAMQLEPQNPEPKLQSGWANYLLKNYAGAIALYQAALAKDPGNSLIYKRMCIAYWALGDKGNSGQYCQKYLQMEPDAPDRSQIERYR